jgi:(E)-4-hydroxy-3-methyl-but-2-enyl pyrophosphate reductase
MKVLIAEKCGFCHGVRNAISMAEKILSREKNVCSLGSIIHNKDVVEHLAREGLKIVNSVEEILSGTVLIPSHGAAPAKIAKLKEKGISIVDATCVLVKKVQHIVEGLESDGYKIVVIGDENHPEVKAVVGCARGVIVLANESDLHKLPPSAKLGIVCQTTHSPDYFGHMLGAIGRCSFSELKVINTLCQEAIKRQESAVQLCRGVDVMFVLGGLESANTRRLAELCKRVNSQTFHLQNWNELDKSIISGKNIAGVTAGASTPEWIIEEFVKNLEVFNGSSDRRRL